MIAAADFWPNFMRNEATNAVCRYYATRGGAALGGLFGGAIGGVAGGQPASLGGRRVGSWIGGGAGAALGALMCPDTPPDTGQFPISPTPGSPFGNCDGVEYDVEATFLARYFPAEFTGLPPVDYTATASARITGALFRIEPVLPGTLVGGLQSFRAAPLDFRDKATGTVIGSFVTSDPSNTPKNQGNNQAIGSFVYTSITRVDGLPDNCPPPPSTPTFPEPGDIPDTRDDPAANTDIDVDVDFGGTTINVNGNLRLIAPVFSPTFGVDFNFDGLNFRWFPDAPIDIGGGSPQPPAGSDPEEDEPPTDKQLRGFFYTVTDIADNQQSELIVAGAFFYPRFGSVRFIGKNRFSESIPMAVTSGYIPNPNPDWFDDFRYTPYRPGNVAAFDLVWQQCGCEGFPTIQRRQ